LIGQLDAPRTVTPFGECARFISRHHAALSFCVYLAVAAFWDRASIAHMGSMCSCGLPGDPAQYTWAFVWFPYALLHGLSLLHTTAMWSPTGIDLAGATATPFLAFLFAPITWVWGPIVSYNVATVLAPATAAGSAYLLCRYVTKSSWAALIAGATFGFGTYETAQLDGHLHLVVIFCVPLAVLTVVKGLDDTISRRRLCLQLAVLLVVQLLISVEVFFTQAVLGATALALAWLLGGAETRQRLTNVIAPIAIAYLLVGVSMSWYFGALLRATAYAKGAAVRFPTDALSFFTPMVYTWIGGHSYLWETEKYKAGPGETDAYIGIPMVLIVIGYIVRRWSSRLAKWFAALLVITVLWILGPRLYIAGKPHIWLPYALFAHLPGFDQVLQGRVAVYLALMCAVILALWLATESRARWLRWSCGAIALALVLPNIASGTTYVATWVNPTFFSTDLYKHYLRRGETILPIRWGWLSESPMWQAETHMYFNMASGYFTTAIPEGWRGPLSRDLWNDTPRPYDARFFRRTLTLRHVSDVVVEADEVASWGPVLQLAGLKPTATVGGVTIYHVPIAWSKSRRR
jgi:hypothetical protein